MVEGRVSERERHEIPGKGRRGKPNLWWKDACRRERDMKYQEREEEGSQTYGGRTRVGERET